MNRRSRTSLIVDDSPEDRELYRRYLLRDQEYSHTILEATLGKQGVELWQQHQPDVILLDYRLPDLDGLEFLARLQPSLQQPCFPVIMVTGQGNEAIAVQAMKAGAQDYLVKGQITSQGLDLAVMDERSRSLQLGTAEYLLKPLSWQKFYQGLNLIFAHVQSPNPQAAIVMAAAESAQNPRILLAEENEANIMQLCN